VAARQDRKSAWRSSWAVLLSGLVLAARPARPANHFRNRTRQLQSIRAACRRESSGAVTYRFRLIFSRKRRTALADPHRRMPEKTSAIYRTQIGFARHDKMVLCGRSGPAERETRRMASPAVGVLMFRLPLHLKISNRVNSIRNTPKCFCSNKNLNSNRVRMGKFL